MRVDAVRMRMAVAAVRASAGDQLDAPAEIDDLRLVFDLCQQHGFEVDKPDIEDHAGFVQADELPGCRLEGFGARSRRYEYFDVEIVADDSLYEAPERQDRDVQRLAVRRAARCAAAAQDGYE